MLIIYYEYDPKLKNNKNSIIRHIHLFKIPKTDLQIIRQDYKKINTKIEKGIAETLSESDTMYLGACTKGNGEISEQKFYAPGKFAKPRAFCLKSSYMTEVLRKNFSNKSSSHQSIAKNSKPLKKYTFEEYVDNITCKYKEKTKNELCRHFNIKIPKSKQQ